MGGVTDFLFGGSQSSQDGHNQSSSSTQSSNQAQNQNTQASASNAANFQNSGSTGYNQAYGPVSSALTPVLGNTTIASNAMADLLGLPRSNFSYNQTPYSPPASVLPPVGSVSLPTPNLNSLVQQVTPPAPASNPSLPPAPVPSPTPTPTPTSGGGTVGGGGGGLLDFMRHLAAGGGRNDNAEFVQARANGGPVQAGQPYVVGENQPELFVPNQSGTILPSVQAPLTPPTGTPGLNSFSNSAGLGFILDNGQKAISGASAGNGVFNSGATGKALVNYGQQLGQTYLNNYMQQLQNYGNLGLGAASALAAPGNVNIAQSQGAGASNSISAGQGSGTSSGLSIGSSNSVGTTTGDSHSKKGLL